MALSDPDFLIVGAGAAGGAVAKELATAGFRVVVLEQGPWLHERRHRVSGQSAGSGGLREPRPCIGRKGIISASRSSMDWRTAPTLRVPRMTLGEIMESACRNA